MHKRKKNLSKTIVLGIITLFILAAISTNISGYNKKTINQTTKETPTGFPLDEDDYINAYWKFDEGYGTTAGDSSGHDYDGEIHGATWVSHSGGYALEFDGVNDYILVDDYAKNYLGFNKTDDMIISFQFKSTSNNKGVIFSICRGDDYGYNPGFHVALDSNGTIQVQVWRLSCGIKMWSENSYNDGEWHTVKIYHNGYSAKSIVYIYVDGELDYYFEKYVCDFYSDNFKYSQIGRNSYELNDYFNGVLDELKIVKYPGGNEQEAPTITGPTSGEPNDKLDFTFITEDPEGDKIEKLYIDWNDSEQIQEVKGPFNSGQEVTVSHTWTEENWFYVKARAKDFWHESPWSEEYPVKIGNAPPTRPIITGKKYGDPQEKITYTFLSEDLEGEDIKYYVDWDDGTTTETNYLPSGTELTEEHSWDTKNDYYIKARATDEKSKVGDWEEYHIRIGDMPPDNVKIYGAVQGYPGVEYEYAFISNDPEKDNVKFDVDWGDGNIETDVGPVPSGEVLVLSHSWNKTKTYKIKAQVKDEFEYPCSQWTEHKVIIPRNKAINLIDLLEMLFERLPRVFLTLRNILGL